MTKYRVTIRELSTGHELIVFPSTRKTTFFPSVQAATKALDARSHKIGDGWVGRVYSVKDGERELVLNMAI